MNARPILFVTGSFWLLLVYGANAHAGDWLIAPVFDLSQAYTDNVTLAEQNKADDLITTISPGVTIRGLSNRLDLNLDYSLEYLKFLDDSSFDNVAHQMQADSEFMLFKDLLFVNASSRMSQQNTNNSNTFSQSNRSQTGNRTSVLSYDYGPAIRQAFGRWASLDASYIFNTQSRTAVGNSNNGGTVGNPGAFGSIGRLGDTDETAFNARLTSGPNIPRIPIGISASLREQDRASGGKNKLRRVTADVGYQVDRFVTLTADIGEESNDVTSGRSRNGGMTWNLGGTWTPTPRSSITGKFGQRAFGKTFQIQAEHRIRRMAFSFSRQEELRTSNQIQSELQLVPLEDAFGVPIFDPGLPSDINLPIDTPTLRDDVILSTNTNATLTYAGRRSDFSFRYFENENTAQESGGIDTNKGTSITFSHQLTQRVTAGINGLWRDSGSQGQFGGGSRVFRVTPSLSFDLGRHIALNLNYEFIDSTGSNGGNSFTENAVTADIAYSF